MGFDLIETGNMLMRIRRRHRYRGSSHPPTLLGVIFLVVAVVLILSVRIWDSKDKQSGKTVKGAAMVVAVIFIILSALADAMGDTNT
jgi:peptidoglycan/LPS O-acetylase OafA/YrhL